MGTPLKKKVNEMGEVHDNGEVVEYEQLQMEKAYWKELVSSGLIDKLIDECDQKIDESFLKTLDENMLSKVRRPNWQWCWKMRTYGTIKRVGLRKKKRAEILVIKNCGFLRVFHEGKRVLRCRYAGGRHDYTKTRYAEPKEVDVKLGTWIHLVGMPRQYPA